jgi:hypothetical protein
MAKNEDNDDLNDEDLDTRNTDDRDDDTGDDKSKSLSEEHKKLLDKLVSDQLSDIKSKLDAAYTKVKEAEKRAEKAEKEAKLVTRKKLEDEGKIVEAVQSELDEVKALNVELQNKLDTYTRDTQVDKILIDLGVEFKNSKAKTLAIRDIIGELIKDEDGVWLHRTGASLKDFVKTFIKDPEVIDTLLKTKDSNGGGAGKTVVGGFKKPAKLTDGSITSEQLLELAKKGALGSYSF